MSSPLAAPAVAPAHRSRPVTLLALLTVGAVCLVAATVEGQTGPAQKPAWEFLVSSGTVVPTGARGDVIQRGRLTAAQLSYVVRPTLAVTAVLGWARSRDIVSDGDPKLDIFTYDFGAEARAPAWISGGRVTFSPFAGVGAGARSYDYRSLDARATHNVATYGSVGGEVGIGRIRIRLEARDYVTGFRPLDGEGSADLANDVVLMAGLRYTKR